MSISKKTIFPIIKSAVFYMMLVFLFLRAEAFRFDTAVGTLSLTSARTLIAVYLVLFLPSAWSVLRERLKDARLLTLMLVISFVLIVISSLIFLFNETYFSFEPLFVVAVYFLFFLSAQEEFWTKRWNKIVWIFTACFLLVTTSNLISHFFKSISSIVEEYPFWPGKNMFAVFLFIGIFFLLDETFRAHQKEKKYLLIPVVLLGFINLLSAYSRAALMAFVGGSIFFVFFLKGKAKLAGVIFILAVIVLGSLTPGVRERVLEAVSMKDYNTRERVAIWKGTIKMIGERPLLGVGAGNFSKVFFERSQDFPFIKVEERKKNYQSHNLFLQIASESGLPAALMLLCVYLSLFFRYLKSSLKGHSHIGLVCIMVSFFLYSFFDTTYNARFTHASMYHINIIMLIFLARIFREVTLCRENQRAVCKDEERT
ncbi:MAG: O-antigen ligase family protein [Candidatus Aureabacteria bacterium]|nr:O-antigen ligase family protein [Candidatus Auribacterota bacterium]